METDTKYSCSAVCQGKYRLPTAEQSLSVSTGHNLFGVEF